MEDIPRKRTDFIYDDLSLKNRKINSKNKKNRNTVSKMEFYFQNRRILWTLICFYYFFY